MKGHRRKANVEQFERINLRQEKSKARLRHEMIKAAMAGGRSGFAVQIQTSGPVLLREARPRAR